jgi:hypothetical protein
VCATCGCGGVHGGSSASIGLASITGIWTPSNYWESRRARPLCNAHLTSTVSATTGLTPWIRDCAGQGHSGQHQREVLELSSKVKASNDDYRMHDNYQPSRWDIKDQGFVESLSLHVSDVSARSRLPSAGRHHRRRDHDDGGRDNSHEDHHRNVSRKQ